MSYLAVQHERQMLPQCGHEETRVYQTHIVRLGHISCDARSLSSPPTSRLAAALNDHDGALLLYW